jgi:hypothetical protein
MTIARRKSILATTEGGSGAIPEAVELDSDGISHSSAGSSPGIQRQKTDNKILTQTQIKDMIDGAMKASIQLKQVDPNVLDELRRLNKKFLRQAQLDQIWIIEQREKLLVGATELEQCIKRENELIKKKRRDNQSVDSGNSPSPVAA